MGETETQNKDSTHIKIPTLNIAVSKQRQLHFMSICKRPGMKINFKASKVVQVQLLLPSPLKALMYFFKQTSKLLD